MLSQVPSSVCTACVVVTIVVVVVSLLKAACRPSAAAEMEFVEGGVKAEGEVMHDVTGTDVAARSTDDDKARGARRARASSFDGGGSSTSCPIVFRSTSQLWVVEAVAVSALGSGTRNSAVVSVPSMISPRPAAAAERDEVAVVEDEVEVDV